VTDIIAIIEVVANFYRMIATLLIIFQSSSLSGAADGNPVAEKGWEN
jgi:hypothetical protein